MTLITTLLDRNGIVLATDSNVTSGGRVIREARKNFELPHLRAGLSVAGCYSVDKTPMDVWMPRFIARPETYERQTLSDFADCLRKALDSEMRREEKVTPTLIHLAGYRVEMSRFHPEFYFIRNVGGIDDTSGEYIQALDAFQADEQFWHEHCQWRDSETGFPASPAPYQSQFYANGLPWARMGCMLAFQSLVPCFATIWDKHESIFNAPRSLEESRALLQIIMSIVEGLFKMTDRAERYVGGEIQLIGVPLPRDVSSLPPSTVS